MPQTNKEKWFMLECSMDKLETMVFNGLQKFIKKKKLGRPKKNEQIKNNQLQNEKKTMAKFLGIDEQQ